MKSKEKSFYQALLARDTRFDGLFFVGVTSTGIYCRPVCPVKPPKFANCRFYNSAQEAEYHGFRPCLRCRPELAPAARRWIADSASPNSSSNASRKKARMANTRWNRLRKSLISVHDKCGASFRKNWA